MALNWGSGASGAASGAAAGTAIMPGVGTAIGGVAGGIMGLFSGNDEEDKTNDILSKIPDELKQYLMPYINAGQGALSNLQGLNNDYQNLYRDPNAIISRIGSGYRESPGYRWRLNQGENAINNAQAAGGMAGTAQHQQQAGELAGHLADQDYNAYMTNALGLFNNGLSGATGINQGIYQTGSLSGGDLASSLASFLNGKAGLSYQRGLNKNQQTSDMWSNILSAAKMYQGSGGGSGAFSGSSAGASGSWR